MNKTMVSYLRGFYSYDRSSNLRVLAEDEEIGTAYEQGKIRGRLPFNRTKILILGDHAVGKTSTCRRLQGRDFRHDEASTVGIETNTVKAKVSDVNSKWCEVSNTPLEDYESSVAWWAVSHVRKTNKRKISKTNDRSWTIVEDAIYQAFQSIPFFLMFLFGGLTFGFGLIAWAYIVCLMSIFDVHTAYRFGSGYAIGMAIIEGAIGMTDNYIEIGLPATETTIIVVDIIMIMLLCGVLSILTGFVVGAGGRTGVCVALCFMVHPKQKEFSFDDFTEIVPVISHTAYLGLLISILAVCSISTFRHVHVQILQLSGMKRVLLSIIVIFTIAMGSIYHGTYSLRLLKYFSIAILVVFIATGTLIGRKCSAYWYIPQSYIIKKSFGFIFGICMAKILGWEFIDFGTMTLKKNQHVSIQHYLIRILLFVIPIMSFLLYECLAYMKVRNTLSVPLIHIRQSMKATIRNETYLDARLSLWDFAGQEMYYNTHHLFMPKQGVYLIVFNAIEAVMNPGKQIKRLQFWLQSVAMHAEIENVIVLLVGTRRENVRDMNALLNFSRLAKAHLYKRFCKLIAFHPSGNMLFYVENALKFDKERITLREVIYNEIKNMKYFQEKFSVKYLLFNETLNRFRLRKSIITRLDAISAEAKSTCNIMSQNELLQFLNFFDRAGDVIYNGRDEVLRNYVICDPQMLVDILQILVNVPEPHKRNRTVADFWQRLEDTGHVDSRLLEHICRVHGIWSLYPYVIRFLVGTYLLFPLKVTNQIEQVGTFCFSCRLPKTTLMSNIWDSNDYSQDIFYFDFGEILPEFIFLRLIAKCCEVFTWDEMYYNAARFRISKSCLFFINTQVISGSVDSYDRNLIKVAVHNEDQTQSISILQKMITFTKEIINRDFNPDYLREQYIYGPVCEGCTSLDGTLFLVNLITPDNDVALVDGYRPDLYHKVSLGPKFSLTCRRTMDNMDL